MAAPTGCDDDIQITGVSRNKKLMSWVSSSFDDFGPSPAIPKSKSFPKSQPHQSHHTEKSRKRPRENSTADLMKWSSSRERISQPKPRVKPDNSELWSDKLSPVTRAELCVQKKKLDEISEWIVNNFGIRRGKTAPILLLSGPPGVGKSACIKVLCSEINLQIQEWSSTSEVAVDQWSERKERTSELSRVDVYSSQSQSSAFQNFLLRANKYQALDILASKDESTHTGRDATQSSESKTIIIVEDIPNAFFREPSQFHDILRKYSRSGHSPLIFIVSESHSSSSVNQKLFPKDIQLKLKISHIKMNPVAPTMMIKLLNKAMNKETKYSSPSPSIIESIAVSSNGDIRAALNTLQFACRTDTFDLKDICNVQYKAHRKKQGSGSRSNTSKTSSSSKDATDETSIGVKDKSIFLFHSVGKILHFKRGDPKEHPEIAPLPPHLSHHARDPLLIDPEEVAARSHLSGDFFSSFLHENYVEFLSNIDDIENVAENFSDADYMTSLWTAREELQKYSLSLATRGYIHYNTEISRHNSPRINHGWKPLHKSQWFTSSKEASDNITTARQLFKGYHWEPEILCTEILPFINLTNPTLHDAVQIRFVQEMTQFSKFKNRQYQRLNEDEVVNEEAAEESTQDTTSSQWVLSAEDDRQGSIKVEAVQARGGDIIDEDSNEAVLGSQSNVLSTENDNEANDDFIIEDFDDEDFL